MATKTQSKSKKKAPAKRKPAKRAAQPQKVSHPPVVHWEVQAKDLVKQQQFFANLFGWKIDANNPMNYGMVSAGAKNAIGGGIGPAFGTSCVTVYVQVPNIDATLAKAESLGARTVKGRTEYGPVIMGLFSDLEGNLIGLVEG